jgi:3-hydroxybutyryl-CoA dehydrogenase
MGKQLAQFLAQAGYQVILYSRTRERLIAAIKKIEKGLMKTKEPHEAKIIMNRIEPTTGLSKLNEAELVIETIIEDLEAKRHLLDDLSSLCPEHTIIATNTSSLPITELASAISNPERFIGMHFFNPVQKMHLVEIVYGQATSKKTIEYAMNFSEALGKTPVVVRDSPGFIVNRSLMPFINEAASLLDEGVSPNDIDNAIRLGLNHPMGPLALADLIGLDICVSIMNTLYQGYNDVRYIPSPAFNKLIQKGHLGKKTGKGFYNYDH